ncbi:MAG: DUF1786 domain-containing protein [Anaerolineales bacterium]|jgi:uncharacterized protein (DUF1786 family)
MQTLSVDIGTGTQDVYLFDSRLDIENGLKLVLPSPTMIIRRKLQAATRAGRPVLLTGYTMGGGPNQWAAEDHLRAGFPVYATPDAARSFNDDLQAIGEMGITVISQDEISGLSSETLRLDLFDFDLASIASVFSTFGVGLESLDAVAVAVFDHGNAPRDYSDRQYRFDYLDKRIRSHNSLSAFAYLSGDVPSIMTRLEAVVRSFQAQEHILMKKVPLVVMDTAPAAVLGATFDPDVSRLERVLIANVGNFHTLAFRLGPSGIEGVFEHHTGFLNQRKLDGLILALADGSLTHQSVFEDNGHGALVYGNEPFSIFSQKSGKGSGPGLVVTGPRRGMMRGSPLNPYFAVPFGDMMLSGCFGLLAATADLLPELSNPIRRSLRGASSGSPPWEVN